MRFYFFWVGVFTAVVLSLRRPFLGCIVYSCMNILRPELFFWGSSRAASSSMQLVIGGIILGCFLNPKQITIDNLKTKELVLLVFLYLAIIASIFYGDYVVPRQFDYANEFIKVAILCALLLVTMNTPAKVYTYEKWLLYCVVFLALWGVEQHFRGNARLEKLGGFDSNGIAAFFVLFFPILFARLIDTESKKERILSFFSTGLVATAILFTQSRGGLLGLIIGVVLTATRSNKKLKIFIYISIVICLSSPLILQQYEGRFQAADSFENGSSMDSSAESRLYLWQAGLLVFRDNPLLGTGFLTYPIAKFEYVNQFSYLPQKLYDAVFRQNSPLVAHNTFITFLSDTGLAGFLPYIFLFIGTLYSNGKVRRRTKKLQGADCTKLLGMLMGIENGIISLSVCNVFINGNQGVMQFVQIIVCAIIRKLINDKLVEIDNYNSAIK